MDQMRNALKMEKAVFDEKIFDWADEFGFRIDGDLIKIQSESVDQFIDMLDSQFKSWESKERIGEGKIVKRAKIAPKIQLTPASAKEKIKKVKEKPTRAEKVKVEPEENANKTVSFKGAQIRQFEAEALQEIETLTKKEFTKVKKVELDTQMGFSVDENQVTGIFLP